MRIETLKTELEQFFGVTIAPAYDIHRLARRLGIPLEEPEPTLEERHPRPWRVMGGTDPLPAVLSAREVAVPTARREIKQSYVAAYNREPLLLEIAEAANSLHAAWRIGSSWDQITTDNAKLGNLLHRLRKAQREEGS